MSRLPAGYLAATCMGKREKNTPNKVSGPKLFLSLPCKVIKRLTYVKASVSHSAVTDSADSDTAAGQAPLFIEFFQARRLDWVAMPFSRASS